MSVPEGAQGTKGEADGKGSGAVPTVEGIVGVEMAALSALSDALGGIDALIAIIPRMEQAANNIIVAGNEGKQTIFNYVQQTVQPAIDQYAVEAVRRAIKVTAQVEAILDPFLAPFRQEDSQ